MGGWEVAILIICLGLLVFTFWQEVKRSNRKYLWLRSTVVGMAVINLACIALPITVTSNATPNKGEAILETEGCSADSVNKFLKNGHINIPVYTLDELKALSQLNFNTVHVFGYGVSPIELQLLNNAHVIFHPSAIGAGITSASWQHVLQTGSALQVQGSFVNNSSQKIRIVLSGLNTVLDSISAQPYSQSNFELRTVPKNTGKAVYSITAIANDKTIEEEFIPVDIKQPDSLGVLMLASSPDFENKFLKNWLSQNAFSVTMRTAITKGKFDKAFVNSTSSTIDKITPPLLDKFDVLVTDASAFAALGKDEQSIIQTKVEGGLGLIIKTDTLLPSAFYAPEFQLFTAQAKAPQVAVKLSGETVFHALPAQQSVYIKNLPGTLPLVTDSSLQILAGCTLYGRGTIALTTINNTYSWMLAGNAAAYGNYWSPLISRAARKKTKDVSIAFNEPFPKINKQLAVKIETSGNNIPTVVIGNSNIYVKQNVDLPFEWEGSYWPVQTGWQTMRLNNDPQEFYVFNANDWQYVTAAEKLKATAQFVKSQNSTISFIQPEAGNQQVPVPKFWFLLVFIVCCTVLWVEKKFNV